MFTVWDQCKVIRHFVPLPLRWDIYESGVYLWCTIRLHLEQSCSSCSPVCWLHWIAGVNLTFNSPLSFKLSSLPVGDDSEQ